ncbi:hypothetical protein COLO4_07033 [Corchorus olitorius]|uniref:Uncharacterized protein n=1 Tax=Corchorus olitorius TaxID=93759 RepID=A0A1R3KL36_9ROSI|nr:hypothetical protein COLO4_07033 [Corchorus olitorius]
MSLKVCGLERLVSSFADLVLVPSKTALKRLDLDFADLTSRTPMEKSHRPMLRLCGEGAEIVFLCDLTTHSSPRDLLTCVHFADLSLFEGVI